MFHLPDEDAGSLTLIIAGAAEWPVTEERLLPAVRRRETPPGRARLVEAVWSGRLVRGRLGGAVDVNLGYW